jgi:hypothetical protein
MSEEEGGRHLRRRDRQRAQGARPRSCPSGPERDRLRFEPGPRGPSARRPDPPRGRAAPPADRPQDPQRGDVARRRLDPVLPLRRRASRATPRARSGKGPANGGGTSSTAPRRRSTRGCRRSSTTRASRARSRAFPAGAGGSPSTTTRPRAPGPGAGASGSPWRSARSAGWSAAERALLRVAASSSRTWDPRPQDGDGRRRRRRARQGRGLRRLAPEEGHARLARAAPQPLDARPALGLQRLLRPASRRPRGRPSPAASAADSFAKSAGATSPIAS